jgi:hypothetical protein
MVLCLAREECRLLAMDRVSEVELVAACDVLMPVEIIVESVERLSSIVQKEKQSMFVRDDSLKCGDRAKDQISGFTGVIVAITEWLNGCRRITIQPSELFEGKPVDSSTFDAEQIELVERMTIPDKKPTGGPSIAPQRHANPTR